MKRTGQLKTRDNLLIFLCSDYIIKMRWNLLTQKAWGGRIRRCELVAPWAILSSLMGLFTWNGTVLLQCETLSSCFSISYKYCVILWVIWSSLMRLFTCSGTVFLQCETFLSSCFGVSFKYCAIFLAKQNHPLWKICSFIETKPIVSAIYCNSGDWYSLSRCFHYMYTNFYNYKSNIYLILCTCSLEQDGFHITGLITWDIVLQ